VRVYRPYGPTIYGYGFHYADESAFPWLAFTALTLILLDNLNEEQIRYHEHAQIQAATAPIGEMIIWDYEGASGNVTALREGTDSRGNQCREFRQSVTIGNQIEEAYGIACLQPDGAWQMVQ
jgi:surface antigen